MDDRLLLSEALEAVSGMLRGYPNRSQADKSYIGALAQIFMQYPRQVAMAAAHPLHGVPRETRFLPTPADIISFCESKSKPLHEQAAREDRIAAQLEAREHWRPHEPPPPAGITYAQFIKNCEANGQKPRPVGAFEPGGYLGGSE